MARALVLGIALAVAAPLVLANPPEVAGLIVQVDREHARLNVLTLDGKEQWIACTEETVVTIDGYAATFGQLQSDYRVAIRLDAETGAAVRVDARSP
jgi:hypothetical protein